MDVYTLTSPFKQSNITTSFCICVDIMYFVMAFNYKIHVEMQFEDSKGV